MIAAPGNADENLALIRWLASRLPEYRPSRHTQCLAVLRSGEICAVVGYDNYRVVDIELTIFAEHPRWATKGTIATLLAYPFIQLGTQRATCMVRKSNGRCRRFLRGIGFAEEGKHRHAGENLETMFSYGMTKQDYMNRYGQQERPPSSTGSTESERHHSDGRGLQPAEPVHAAR